MADVVDIWAREQIGKLWGSLRDATGVLWGDNVSRDNGLRSSVRALEVGHAQTEKRINEMDDRIRHYIDVERENTCHGIAALEEHKADHAREIKEEVAVKVAKIEAGSKSWVQFLQLAGILATALIALLK